MTFVSLVDPTPGERRVALTPTVVRKIVALGASVVLEHDYGASLHLTDDVYVAAGATFTDRAEALRVGDVVVGLTPASPADVASSRRGSIWIGFFDPFRRGDLVRACTAHDVTSLCMELIPRTSYAQKMDALSSQASLAGYAAVVRAAERSAKSFPMMSTPAGTIPPARVFVVGVGVAGLQAIATAKRLGARVEAYDTRPVVAEQVASLGAKFVSLDVGETGQNEQGYARELTPEQLASQRRQMAKVVAGADVVITTAQLFGRPAPRIVDDAMVAGMRPGSVVVDMAASTGGNVEGSVPGQEVVRHGVLVVGDVDLPSSVARDASEVYAANVFALIEHAWNAEQTSIRIDPDGDEIVAATLLTHHGVVRDARVAAALGEGSSA